MIDLIKSSVLTQAIITFMVLAIDAYMYIAGRAVDDKLWALTTLVVGFYFGSKIGIVQGRADQAQTQALTAQVKKESNCE